MKESEIEKKVCAYAEEKGMLVYKFVCPSHRGVPDRLFLTRSGDCFFIEFKAPGKKPRAEQLREIAKIDNQGFSVYVIDNICNGMRMVDFHDE